MGLTKRIIPCLDIKDGTTVKGIQFEQLRNMGDPVELAIHYASELADELVFLDISATDEKRKTLAALVSRIASKLNIPFTVGGGISSVDDVYTLLNAGADKVSMNTAAVKNSQLITDVAKRFGSQCVVLAVDTKVVGDEWLVYLNGGKIATLLRTLDWIQQAADLGAGEILLTSIDHDGTRNGFAKELIKTVASMVSLPLIASGGAGNAAHFKEILEPGFADAALAAGIFHSKELRIPSLKQYLQNEQIPVRL